MNNLNAYKNTYNRVWKVNLHPDILFDLYPEILEEQNIQSHDISEVFAVFDADETDGFNWVLYVKLFGMKEAAYWGDELMSTTVFEYYEG